MNGPSSVPTPDASPIIATLVQRKPTVESPPEAPPVVAPPIVRPPHCEDPAPTVTEPLQGNPASSLSRGLRDVMIGGICLIVGMVAAQSHSLLRDQTRTFARADTSLTPANDTLTISAAADLTPAPPAPPADMTGLTATPSRPDASVETFAVETKPGVPSIETAIEVADDDVLRSTVEPDTAPAADPPISHSLISQHSTSRQQPDLQKTNPAAALQAIVAAQASLKSLPRMETRSTIIPAPQCQDGTCQQNTRSLDTVLNWADTPAEAYQTAGETEKLVFLIHVSGNFEIPGFT